MASEEVKYLAKYFYNKNTGVVVPCARLGWRLFLFENTPYFLSKESNKDRDNRDENHKEIHLGLLWQYPPTRPT